MRMEQVSNGPCFVQEIIQTIASHLDLEHFDGCQRLQVNVLAQVDISKASPP